MVYQEIFPLSYELNDQCNILKINGVDEFGFLSIVHCNISVVGFCYSQKILNDYRKTFSGVNFDIYAIHEHINTYDEIEKKYIVTKKQKLQYGNNFLYMIVTDSLDSLNWFMFNQPDFIPAKMEIPRLALLFRFIDLKPYKWIIFHSKGIKNKQLSNIKKKFPSINSPDLERRYMMAKVWKCPLDVIDTINMCFHFIAWRGLWIQQNLFNDPTNIIYTDLKYTDEYVAELFAISIPYNSNPFYYSLYKVLDMGYYPSKPDVSKLFPFYADKDSNNNLMLIKKEELFYPPLHLKDIIIELRKQNLTFNDIYVSNDSQTS